MTHQNFHASPKLLPLTMVAATLNVTSCHKCFGICSFR
jgi:hypothetical protein